MGFKSKKVLIVMGGSVKQRLYVNANEGRIYRLKKNGFKEVGSYTTNGYLVFGLNGKLLLNHRFIYEHVYGGIPDGFEVNHKNHQRDDNRIDNLELVTRSQNMQYMKKARNNTSGIPNICWYSPLKKYVIRFYVDKKNKHYGYYAELNNNTIDKRNEIARKLNEEYNCKYTIVDYFGEIVY